MLGSSQNNVLPEGEDKPDKLHYAEWPGSGQKAIY